MSRASPSAYGQIVLTGALLTVATAAVVLIQAVPGLMFKLLGAVVMTYGLALLMPVIGVWLVGTRLVGSGFLTLPYAIGGVFVLIFLVVVPIGGDTVTSRLSGLTQVLYYRGELLRLQHEALARGETPAVAVLPLEGFGSIASGMAFDPSDQLLLPAARRDPRWKSAVAKTDLDAQGLWSKRVLGHFYQWNHP